MTATVNGMGKSWEIDPNFEVFVFVPEGKKEAHVFAGGKFVGTSSDLRTLLGWCDLAEERVQPRDTEFNLRITSAAVREGRIRDYR